MTSPLPEPIDDPYAWLEDVEGDEQLAWVRAANAESEAELTAAPGFDTTRDRILAILDSKEKIAHPGRGLDGFVYNFWTDADHQRGIWRRTTFEDYRTGAPTWDVVLDVDALNAAEGENWVWHGASIRRTDHARALVSLSRGGADADVTREFDMSARTFVEGGFFRPEAKGYMSWRTDDSVFVRTDFGEGTLTTSGYPREVRILERGQALEDAAKWFEVAEDDMSAWGGREHTVGFERDYAQRSIAFYKNETWVAPPGGELVKIDVPDSADAGWHREWLTVTLRDDWEVGGTTYKSGSLLVIDLDGFLAGDRAFTVLFEPTDATALVGLAATRNTLIVNVLEDVKNVLHVWRWSTVDGTTTWTNGPLAGAPTIGTVQLLAWDDEETDEYLMIDAGYTTPTTLRFGTVGEEPEVLAHLPAFFDADGLEVSQHFATSDDGTLIPYFQVGRADLPLDGSNPTLLYGYGGFEVSMTPSYSGGIGAWLESGGVYVSANIRGGGEYGPRWHASALRENRMRCYEDFAAVAKDLVARGVTTAAKLGTQGGSNGGLLMGNMMTLYPQLFGAIVCQVPLLDMKRYNHLLAGASWMAEYGDPDGDDWGFIQGFSPYHNVRADLPIPPVLFTTSTRDDRVHPGHARKMFARMRDQGHDVRYYENIEGGHGGAADNKQSAFMTSLAWTFLRKQLGLPL